MVTNAYLNIPKTPSAEEIWEEFQSAYKNFVKEIVLEPTHVIIPSDKLQTLRKEGLRYIKHHQVKIEDTKVNCFLGVGLKDTRNVEAFNTLYKINGYKVVESSPFGDILFSYLKE